MSASNSTSNHAAQKGTPRIPLIINGQAVFTKDYFHVKSPISGDVIGESCAATLSEAEAAIEAANAAFPAWRDTPAAKRRDIFLNAAQVLERRRDELAGYMMTETGATRGWADFNLSTAKDFLVDIAGRIGSISGFIPTTQSPSTGAFVFKEPYGVVLGVAPWNAPYILGTRAIAFPVAAGNTAILKGSELSPRVMWGIVSVFEEAGLPPGVLNFITHAPKDAAAVTEHLIAHPQIKKINFTGSTAVGRIIGQLAGKYIKPVLLELGGKAPAIVWEDADIEVAATQCALGSFLNSGQICMSTERIIVHSRIWTEFERRFEEKLQQLFDPEADAPVLIQAAAVEKNANLVRDALSKGAELIYGDLADLQGACMRPLVLSDVTKDADIYRIESFGSSVSIYTVETEAEAIELANDTEYGLSAAVFTKDLGRGLRIAKSIESGAVHINSMTVHDESALPHGGVKASGFGRFNGKAIEEWVKTKTVTFQIDK